MSASHRVVGEALGVHGDVETLKLACSCGAKQTETVDSDMSIKQALAEATCLFCGRRGLKRAPR